MNNVNLAVIALVTGAFDVQLGDDGVSIMLNGVDAAPALQKFSDLVVKQCLEIIDDASYKSGDEWDQALAHAHNDISKRFEIDA